MKLQGQYLEYTAFCHYQTVKWPFATILSTHVLRIVAKGYLPTLFFTFVKWPFATILSTHVLRIVAKGHLTGLGAMKGGGVGRRVAAA